MLPPTTAAVGIHVADEELAGSLVNSMTRLRRATVQATGRSREEPLNTSVFDRIIHAPHHMRGKPCLRDMQATVGMVAGHVASGHSKKTILQSSPCLEVEDIRQAVAYAVQPPKVCSLD